MSSTQILAIVATLICVLTNSIQPTAGSPFPASHALDASPPIVLNIPLAEQPISVARVNQPFSYAVSPQTFTSIDGGTLSYAAFGAPSWITWDPVGLTLTGTPMQNKDLGCFPVEIRVTLLGNEAAQCSDSMVVIASDDLAPVLNEPFLLQLAPGSNESELSSAYPYPDDSVYAPGVRVPPGWSFSIGLEPFTFTQSSKGTGREIYYSAASYDDMPLPDWLKFDNRSVTFDGVAPWFDTNEGQTFHIKVFGSDHFGYQDIFQSFNVTVSSSSHILSLDDGVASMNVTAGAAITGGLELIGGISMDGRPLVNRDAKKVDVDVGALGWLTFNQTGKKFGGIPPAENINGIITVNISDTHGDNIVANVSVLVFPSVFSPVQAPQTFPPAVNGTFETPIATLFAQSSSANHSVNLGNITYVLHPSYASAWVRYSNITQTFFGTPPASSSINYTSVRFDLNSMSSQSHAISHANFTWTLAGDGTVGVLQPGGGRGHKLSHTAVAVLVALGAIGLSVLLMIAFFTFCRVFIEVDKHQPIESIEYGANEVEKGFGERPTYCQGGILPPILEAGESIASPGSSSAPAFEGRDCEDWSKMSRGVNREKDDIRVVKAKWMSSLTQRGALLVGMVTGKQAGYIANNELSPPTPVSREKIDDPSGFNPALLLSDTKAPETAVQPPQRSLAERLQALGIRSSRSYDQGGTYSPSEDGSNYKDSIVSLFYFKKSPAQRSSVESDPARSGGKSSRCMDSPLRREMGVAQSDSSHEDSHESPTPAHGGRAHQNAFRDPEHHIGKPILASSSLSIPLSGDDGQDSVVLEENYSRIDEETNRLGRDQIACGGVRAKYHTSPASMLRNVKDQMREAPRNASQTACSSGARPSSSTHSSDVSSVEETRNAPRVVSQDQDDEEDAYDGLQEVRATFSLFNRMFDVSPQFPCTPSMKGDSPTLGTADSHFDHNTARPSNPSPAAAIGRGSYLVNGSVSGSPLRQEVHPDRSRHTLDLPTQDVPAYEDGDD